VARKLEAGHIVTATVGAVLLLLALGLVRKKK
jgi:LPXTG-motif cell wall-anchored protein